MSALRVLAVTGGHPYEREPFAAMLASVPGIALDAREHPEAGAWLGQPDAPRPDVMLCYDFAQQLGEDARRNLEAWIDGGMGLVVLHHAIHTYTAWPRWREIVGGFWDAQRFTIGGTAYGPSTWRMTTVPVRVADPGHPITAGLASFEVADECYGDYWIADDAQPLLLTDLPESHRVLGWTRRHGRGRVVYLQPGHGPEAYRHPGYRRLLERSLRWAGGDGTL